MNPDALERLLLDDALGALEPDVQALLHHHVNEHPEHAAQQRGFSETVDATRKHLCPTAEASPPDYQRLLQATPRVHRSRQPARWVCATAVTALLIGLSAGWWLHPKADSGAPEPTYAQQHSPMTTLPFARGIDEASPSFWSTKRLLQQYTQH